LDADAPVTGAPTNFLKSRRMSARKNLAGNAASLNQSYHNRSGSGFFGADSGAAQTFKGGNAHTQMGNDIQSLIDGFHAGSSSFKDGIKIKVK